MNRTPITFQATLLTQAGWVVDFLALTEKDSGLRHGAGKDVEIRGRIINSLLTENPVVLGLGEAIKGYQLPHREAAINYMHMDLEAMIDPELPEEEQMQQLLESLRNQDPILEAKNIREREYVKEPPVKPIGFSVNIGIKDGSNTLEVILPALNSLDAQNHALAFVRNHRPDLNPSDVYAYTAMPSMNDHADFVNQGFEDYKSFPNRTTHDVYEFLTARPDLIEAIHKTRDPRPGVTNPLGLSKKDIKNIVSAELSTVGGDLDICPELDGRIHWRSLHDHLNEYVNGVEAPAREIIDNRDNLAADAEAWFERTITQKAVLQHITPVINAESYPEHLKGSPMTIARSADALFLALKSGKDISQSATLNKEHYGSTLKFDSFDKNQLLNEIQTTATALKSGQNNPAVLIPESGFTPA